MKIQRFAPLILTALSLLLLAACSAGGPVDLGGLVWLDANANGLRDEGEARAPGIPAQLFGKLEGQSDFAQIEETATDEQGNYGFSDLQPGDYYVQFRLPEELAFTYPDVGDDDEVDSEADNLTGQTKPVSFAAEPQLSQDAGLLPIPDLVHIGGWVWEDWNDNGVQDGDENSLPGVPLSLLDISAGGTDVLHMTTSDPSGMYSFYILPGPGEVQVEVLPPDGFETVLRDQGGDDNADSDVDPVSRRSDPVSASEDQVVDIGLAPLSGIADWAWLDANGDGIQGADEVGLEDVFVFLYRFDKDGNVFVFHDLVLTDADGFYEFYPLRPGTYYLRFLPPEGFGYTLFNAGDDVEKDSDALQDTGATPDILLPDDAVFLDILISDIWDAGFVQSVSDLASYSFENDANPFVCDTEEPADDPEVRVSTVRAVRLPNGDLWVLVRMARALEQDYSFAVILYIRTPAGTIAFLWEIHEQVLRMGQIDPNTGELIREIDAQLQAFHHRGMGIVGFYVPGSLLPVGTDLGILSSFHTPVEGEMKVCGFTPTFNVP